MGNTTLFSSFVLWGTMMFEYVKFTPEEFQKIMQESASKKEPGKYVKTILIYDDFHGSLQRVVCQLENEH